MSDSSLQEDSANDREPPARSRTSAFAALPTDAVANPVRVVSFWTAAVLPVGYLLLFAWGLDSPERAGLFVALVAANVVALVLGRPHTME